MCGITGMVNLDNRPVDRTILEDMVRVQGHRGPDDKGIYLSGNIGLGHSRLSIIDLSKEAGQPMSNEDGTFLIIHNGEIYNYLELKEELRRAGHHFKTRSDTEVILHAYEEWGEDCTRRFNGMWAFAILNLKNKTLFCSRDRFGVKPFYYYEDDEVFAFASEIKALLKHPRIKREPDGRAIFNYLASGYGYMDISDGTFFKKVRQLKPSHSLKISLKGKKLNQARYWDLDPGKKNVFKDEEDAYRRFYEHFEDAVRLRLRSDVPLGVSLSGGLDSSSIACVAAKLLGSNRLEAFSSCFDEEKEHDERRFINPVLDRTRANANLIFTRPENVFSDMESIIWHQDEPYSTLSILPQWYVMKLAHEKGVKVLLTGQGGDETLAGYHKYYYYLFADLINSLKWDKASREIRIFKGLKGGDGNVSGAVAKILLAYSAPEFLKSLSRSRIDRHRPSYLNRDFVKGQTGKISIEKKFASILNNDLYNALKISPLPSLLHIDDRSSMAHSVESRSPFLDYRLVEYLFSLGPEFKIRDGLTKYVLRMSLKGVIPEEVRLRKDKMGFATPLERWLKTGLKAKALEIFSSREFASRPYFDQKEVLRIFKDFTEGRTSNGHYMVWSWLNLELWFRKFFN
ncbi:MAG: asparagine synthase (glutamine-hydrolyzing) [Candidatus Omnitrophica bacterium]|nr:asparagine synthase (glutamine-hydrolyzing) [Candidatus Omnitrophota bacterium]